MADTQPLNGRIPVYLLKTKSTPTDAYEDLFSTERDGVKFAPDFVPVLEHRFLDAGLDQVRSLLRDQRIGAGPECHYGGLVFTSQRAVEAFTHLVKEGSGEGGGGDGGGRWPHLRDVPVYSVGPATTRALKAIPQAGGGLQVFGEHTGNGDVLAQFILEHYGDWYRDRGTKPPLLFLVGEQRRDIIPKTLMDEALPASSRIQVDEVVVYGTGVMESFEEDFRERLARAPSTPDTATAAAGRWVVVFSSTGCEDMLRVLGLLREDGQSVAVAAKPEERPGGPKTFVATIGPTTRSFLQRSFGFEPEVCSEQPSPEGLWSGITEYISNIR